MLCDIDREKIHTPIDCLTCKYFDKQAKKCEGLGKRCFEYDPLTQTIIEPYSKLPLNIKMHIK